MNEENKFLGEMLWKVFDFVTLGTFESNMEVPSEEPTKKKKHHTLSNINGTIGLSVLPQNVSAEPEKPVHTTEVKKI